MYKQINRGRVTNDFTRIVLRSFSISNVANTNIINTTENVFKSENIPNKSNVVICGAGIIGCSVAYHLSKVKGFNVPNQIVCIDSGQIAETSPWSINTGVIGVTKLSSAESRFAQQSMKVLNELNTLGYDTGLRKCGALNLARKKDRMTEFRKIKTQSMSKGISCQILSSKECLDLCPYLEISDLEGGILIPDDSIADSKSISLALAEQAKKNGVSFIENCRVNKILVDSKKESVQAVATNRGTIECTYFVNCAGLWARELGQMCEIPVKVPIYAVANHVLTSKFDQTKKFEIPIIRDLDGRIYFRESFGKLHSGGYEKEAKPVYNDNFLPDSPSERDLYADWDHFRILLKEMLHRIPALKDASFERLTNIPEAYSSDGLWILGESTEVRNYFVAAGTKTDGISSFGGVGQVISELITQGFGSQDFHNLDINRFLGLHNNRRFLRDRAMEVPGRHYSISYPYSGEFVTGRNIRMSPIFPMLKTEGAVFGQTMGYERPFYFDKENSTDTTRLMIDTKTFSKPAYFDLVAKEYECCRERVALLDYSSFTKIDIWGQDVVKTLQYLCSNDVDVPIGSIIHTGMQNSYGGYENDCSLARISENYYMMIAPTIQQQRCKNWLKKHIPTNSNVHFSDVTSKYTAICIMGPFSRNLLSEVTDCDVSSQHFPFFSYREIDVGLANGIRALNLTHTGEIGYVLYIPNEFALHVYTTLLEAGQKYDIGLSGYLAMRSLRVEKFYAFWGQDLDTFTTPLECGRSWRVKFNKGNFIGREALLKQKAEGIKRVYLQLILTDHDADLDVWTSNNGGEPIYRNGKISGYTTTSSYGFSFKTQVCLGFVENHENGSQSLPVTTDYILGGDYEVEVAGIRYSAKVNLHSPNLPTKADIPTDKDREEYQATRDKVDDSYFL